MYDIYSKLVQGTPTTRLFLFKGPEVRRIVYAALS